MKKLITLIAFIALVPLTRAQTSSHPSPNNVGANSHPLAQSGAAVIRTNAGNRPSNAPSPMTGNQPNKAATSSTPGVATRVGNPGPARQVCRTVGSTVYYCL